MMFITTLKFLHVLIALSLMGLTIYCFVAVGAKRFSYRFNKILFGLGLITLFTGTFLVYPRHFTFHTPWIEAAYGFTVFYLVSILFLILEKNKLFASRGYKVIYFILIIVLIAITHDAVTKTSIFLHQ